MMQQSGSCVVVKLKNPFRTTDCVGIPITSGLSFFTRDWEGYGYNPKVKGEGLTHKRLPVKKAQKRNKIASARWYCINKVAFLDGLMPGNFW